MDKIAFYETCNVDHLNFNGNLIKINFSENTCTRRTTPAPESLKPSMKPTTILNFSNNLINNTFTENTSLKIDTTAPDLTFDNSFFNNTFTKNACLRRVLPAPAVSVLIIFYTVFKTQC